MRTARKLRNSLVLAVACTTCATAQFTDDQWIPLGGGIPGANDTVYAAVMDDAGGVYIGGLFTLVDKTAASYIAYWNGLSWTNLGTGLDANVKDLALDSVGNLYAIGNFHEAGGVTANYIAMWDGASWTNLGEGLNDDANALVIDSSDNVYVGGGFTTAGVVSVSRIAMWNGSSWTNIAPGLDEEVGIETLAVDSATNLYIGGYFETIGSLTTMHIACWCDGSWTNLGEGTDDGVGALVVDAADNLYAGGDFTTAGTTPANRVAMWNGSSWTNLGSGTDGSVRALDLTESGKLLVGGDFYEAGGDPDALYIAQWDGTGWTNFYDSLDSTVFAIAGSDTNGIFAGGWFTRTYNEEVPMERIAYWDGSQWNALGDPPLFDGQVRAVAVDKDSGYVYYGGDFTMIGDLEANRVARWDGSSWTNLGMGMNGSVYTLMVDGNGDPIAGGQFSQADGTSDNRYLSRWDGSNWTNFGIVNYFVYSLSAGPSNSFYAGGRFSTVDGLSAKLVAHWTGTSWTNLGDGLVGDANRVVNAIVPDSLGNVYAGGYFNGSGVSFIQNLARWTGTGWTNVWPNPSGLGTVRALKVDSSNRLYVAAVFSGFNNDVQRYDGVAFSNLTPGVGTSPVGLAIDDDDNVYTVGSFESAGVSQYAPQIAFWDNTAWTNLGSGLGPDDGTLTWAVELDGAGNPYVGGSFQLAGGRVSQYAAYALVNPAANLIVTKEHLSEPALAGGSIVYTITVSNAGPSDATGVVVNDTLPPGFTATSPTNIAVGSLPFGATTSVTVSADISSGNLGLYTNVATASANEADPFPMSDTAYDETTVVPGADLSISIYDNIDPAFAGNPLFYNVTVTNKGPSDAQNVEVVNMLPPGVTPGGTLTNSIGTLAAGTSTTVQFGVIVNSSTTAGTLTNHSSVTSTTTDNVLTNNSDVELTGLVVQADLDATLTAAPEPAAAGSNVCYTLTVTNTGPADANTVVLSIGVPNGFETNVIPSGWGVASNFFTIHDRDLSTFLPSLVAGASTTVVICLDIDPSLLGAVTNYGYTGANTADPNVENSFFGGWAEVTTTVESVSDLSITKSDDTDPVVAGTGLGYSITVTNNGPSDAYDVEVVDTMPAGFTPGGMITNTIGTLAVGASTTLQFNAAVGSGVEGIVTNVAEVTSTSTDTIPANSTAEEATTVIAEVDLDVVLTDSPDPATAGSNIYYTATVTNAGPSDASLLSVLIGLPDGFETNTIPPGWFVLTNFPSGDGRAAGGFVATLNAGATTSLTVCLDIDPSVLGSLVNTTYVNSATTDTAPESGFGGIGTQLTTIESVADVGISKTDDVDPVVAGTTLNYTVTVTNNGPSDAYEVEIFDAMPSEVTPGGITTNFIGTLAAGAGTSLQFSVTVDAAASGAITNTAYFDTDSDDPESNNDMVEEVTLVIAEADLFLTKVADQSLVLDDSTITYTLTVSNVGPSHADGILLTDFLPAGVSPGGTPIYGVGPLAAGSVTSIQLAVTVDETTIGVITNKAVVTTTATDPNSANDSAEAETTIQDLDGDGIPDFADPDRDGDGIPDWWEVLHYGGPTNATPNAPAANGENTVLEAWIADLNPTNPASVFPPVGLTNAPPGIMVLTINPVSTSRVYDVLSNTNLLLNPQMWMPHSGILTGTPDGLVFPVTNDAPPRNYRTRVRLPE